MTEYLLRSKLETSNYKDRMKQILFILTIWTMLPFHGSARNPYHESDTIPKGFECFQTDCQRVFINYTVSVKGYSVKAMWIIYDEEKAPQKEETVIHFENEETGSTFYVRTGNKIDYNLDETERVITLDKEPPCTFLDADFDGKKEQLIFYGNGSSEDYNLEGAYPELITEKPFTELNQNSKFDPVSKTFTNVSYSNGGLGKTVFTYQRQDYDYWFTEKVGAYNCYKFELVNIDVKEHNVIPITRHKVYQRIGNKLELIKKELIIEDLESLKLLEEDLETCQDLLLSKEYEELFNNEE